MAFRLAVCLSVSSCYEKTTSEPQYHQHHWREGLFLLLWAPPRALALLHLVCSNCTLAGSPTRISQPYMQHGVAPAPARVVMVVLRHARALQLVPSRSLVALQALQLARLQAGESHGPQHRVSRQREGGHRRGGLLLRREERELLSGGRRLELDWHFHPGLPGAGVRRVDEAGTGLDVDG